MGTGEGVPAPGVICRGVRKPSRRCYRLRESRAHPLSHPSAPRASGAGRDRFLGVTLCHPYWGGSVGTAGPGPGSPRCAARGRCCRQRAHLAAATASRCPRPGPAAEPSPGRRRLSSGPRPRARPGGAPLPARCRQPRPGARCAAARGDFRGRGGRREAVRAGRSAGMAAMSSLEAVRRKIRSLQEQADAAEERAGRLQREVDQERALREEVGLPGPARGPRPGGSGRGLEFGSRVRVPGRSCLAAPRPAGQAAAPLATICDKMVPAGRRARSPPAGGGRCSRWQARAAGARWVSAVLGPGSAPSAR